MTQVLWKKGLPQSTGQLICSSPGCFWISRPPEWPCICVLSGSWVRCRERACKPWFMPRVKSISEILALFLHPAYIQMVYAITAVTVDPFSSFFVVVLLCCAVVTFVLCSLDAISLLFAYVAFDPFSLSHSLTCSHASIFVVRQKCKNELCCYSINIRNGRSSSNKHILAHLDLSAKPFKFTVLMLLSLFSQQAQEMKLTQ